MLERIERQKKAVFSLSLLDRTKLIHFSSHWKCCMEMETCEEKLHLFALESETFNCTFLFVYSILAQKRRVQMGTYNRLSLELNWNKRISFRFALHLFLRAPFKSMYTTLKKFNSTDCHLLFFFLLHHTLNSRNTQAEFEIGLNVMLVLCIVHALHRCEPKISIVRKFAPNLNLILQILPSIFFLFLLFLLCSFAEEETNPISFIPCTISNRKI